MTKIVFSTVVLVVLPLVAQAQDVPSDDVGRVRLRMEQLQRRQDELRAELAGVKGELAKLRRELKVLADEPSDDTEQPQLPRHGGRKIEMPEGYGCLVTSVDGAERIWLRDRTRNRWYYTEVDAAGVATSIVPAGTYEVFVKKPRSRRMDSVFDVHLVAGDYRKLAVTR